MSEHGLLTTVAYKMGKDKPAYYALEVNILFCLLRYSRYFKSGSCIISLVQIQITAVHVKYNIKIPLPFLSFICLHELYTK